MLVSFQNVVNHLPFKPVHHAAKRLRARTGVERMR
jgi:hypothetical protein